MQKPRWPLASFALALLVTLTACGTSIDSDPIELYPNDDRLRLNQIQIMASHISYHSYPAPEPMATVIRQQYPFYPSITGDYRHKPLYQQLDEFGVRYLELDVNADLDGGSFYQRPSVYRLPGNQ